MKITDAIYTDLGFTTIRKWLATEAFSEQNKDDFLHLSPTSNRTELLESHQFTEEILGGLHREEVLPIRHIPNTESWMDQLGIAGSQLDGENFKALLNLLVQSREIKVAMTTEYYPHWATQLDGLISFPQGEKQIYSVYDDAFEIRHDASAELRQIYSDIDKTRGQVQSRLHSLFTQAQSSGWLQDDHIAWRNGRSVLPMKASQKRKIKGIVQSQSATGQTVFIEPLEIIELNNDLTHLEFKRVEEIGRILRGLTTFFKPYKNELFTTIHLLVKIDFHYTFAKFAHHTESSAPLFSEENNLILEEARNPILELAEKEVVPLQMNLSADETILLLSGPNAGGKTVALKTVGLFSIMAQCGLFIPAKKCILPIYTQLLCDIGDQQSIEDDLSTFSAHIQNLTKITETADENAGEIRIGAATTLAAYKTRKCLKDMRRHQAVQHDILTTGSNAARQRIRGRLNDHMEQFVAENGGAGVRRKANKKFKTRKIPSKDQDQTKKKSQTRSLPAGSMLRHIRTQSRGYLGKEARKFLRSAFLEPRIARADDELQKESIPPLRKTVWVKGKNGKPGFMRMDPRRRRAKRALRQEIRAQVPLDITLNENLGQFPDRRLRDIPLIQIDSSDDENKETGLIGKFVKQKGPDKIPGTEVSLTTFLSNARQFANQSEDEDHFTEDGNFIQVKIEEVTDDESEDHSQADVNSDQDGETHDQEDEKPNDQNDQGPSQESTQTPQNTSLLSCLAKKQVA